jgi:hypothetical protein
MDSISQIFTHNLAYDFHRKPWTNSIRTISDEDTDVVNLPSLRRLHHKSNLRSLLLENEVMMYPSTGNEAGEGHTSR